MQALIPGAPYTWVNPTRGSPGTWRVTGGAAQLHDDLVHLPQARRADRLAVGDAAAVGVDRQPATDLGVAGLDELGLGTVLAQPGLGQVHQLRAGLGVLHLRDVDVVGPDRPPPRTRRARRARSGRPRGWRRGRG